MDNTAIGILLGFIASLAVFGIIFYILQIVAYWKIFTKAGEPGWKSIIPIYNAYTQFKITWNPVMFWAALACFLVGSFLSGLDSAISVLGTVLVLVGTVINLIATHKLSQAFGHGLAFTIGLILFNPIFMLILGFGSSQYEGNNGGSDVIL